MKFLSLILLALLAFLSAEFGEELVFLPPVLFFISLSLVNLRYWKANKRKYLLGVFIYCVLYFCNFIWASLFEFIDDYINLEWANLMSLMSAISTPLVYFSHNYLTEKETSKKGFILYICLGIAIPILSLYIEILNFQNIQSLILLWQIIIGSLLILMTDHSTLHSTHSAIKPFQH